MNREIKFFSRWRVEGNLPEVSQILTDLAEYPRWWSEAWAQAEVVDPGDEAGLWRITSLGRTGGALSGRLMSWRLVADERPLSWVMEINGAFAGRGVWSLHQDGPMADIGHEWRVSSTRLPLRLLGPLGEMVCRASLRRTMQSGEGALAKEVVRRRSHRGG